MKIIALLPVKNEEWVLRFCLDSLSFVDEILAIDDNSTDKSKEILKEYNCTIIPFDTTTTVGWKEFDIRSKLLHEARIRNATHIIAIDADEACSPLFQKNAKEIFAKLGKGQSLVIEWINVCSREMYKPPRIYKSFAMCDDGVSEYQHAFLGVSRVPQTTIPPLHTKENECIFHYQCVNTERSFYKQAWYMLSEYLKKERSVKRINATYAYALDQTCVPFEPGMLSPEKLPDPTTDHSIWQKDAILELFKKHSISFFEPLDIWNNVFLENLFIEEIGRKPKPVTFPKWLLFLNKIKNKIKTRYAKSH